MTILLVDFHVILLQGFSLRDSSSQVAPRNYFTFFLELFANQEKEEIKYEMGYNMLVFIEILLSKFSSQGFQIRNDFI